MHFMGLCPTEQIVVHEFSHIYNSHFLLKVKTKNKCLNQTSLHELTVSFLHRYPFEVKINK